MEKVYDKCCGIDVHKKLIVACLLCGKESEVQEFGATTDDLLKLSDWLVSAGCEMVAMESTASYWKPLYNVLEYSGLNAIGSRANLYKVCIARSFIVGILKGRSVSFDFGIYIRFKGNAL